MKPKDLLALTHKFPFLVYTDPTEYCQQLHPLLFCDNMYYCPPTYIYSLRCPFQLAVSPKRWHIYILRLPVTCLAHPYFINFIILQCIILYYIIRGKRT
jgi:hypothetical protein